jgi:hypothetical protein
LQEAAVKIPIGGRGGIIFLSTDVNATVGSQITDWIGAKLRTLWQRCRKERWVDRIVVEQLGNAGVGIGWSIGPTLLGRYYDPEKKVLYIERAFSVEIFDAPYPLLQAITEALRRTFQQQEVILRSYDTGEAEHTRSKTAR